MTNRYISIPLHHNVYDMQAHIYTSGAVPVNTGIDMVHVSGSNGVYYFDLIDDISSYDYVEARVYKSGSFDSNDLLWVGSLVPSETICRDNYPPLLNIDANLTNVNGNSLRVGTFANWLDNNRLDDSISNLPTKADIRHQIEMLNGVRNWPVYGNAPLFEPSGIDNGTATWPNTVSISATNNHIYYSALDESGRYCINHRTLSADGRSVGSPTRIIVGDQSYDQGGLFLPVVEREGSTLHMFYCGMPSLFANQQVCYATATTGDPTNFTKQGVVIPYSGLPSYVHGGIEPTALLKNGSTYYLYFCSVKGTQSPGYGTYISQQDRRAGVATSTDLTNWTLHPLLCSTGVESAQQAFLYLISGNAFRASSGATALFYLIGAGGGVNTDYQQIELFESPSPLFPIGYTKHIGTILTTNESGGGFPTSEIDVIDIMTDDIEKDTYVNSSGEIRIYFGGKSYGESWKLGLITQPNISEALRPPIQTHNMRMTSHLSSFPSIEIDEVYNSIGNILTVSEFEARTPSSGAILNIERVYLTDFGDNYSAVNNGWRTYPAGYYDQGQGSNQQFPDNFASLIINGSGHISRVTLLDSVSSGVASSISSQVDSDLSTAHGSGQWVANTGDIVSAMLTEADSFKADVSNLPTITYLTNLMNSGIYITSVSSGAVQDIFSTYPIAESYAATGVEGTPAQILYFMQQTFSQFEIGGVTITVKKLDGSTTAATFVMDSSGSPTSRTRAT